MNDAFADVEFLAGSPNRVAVLGALVERPRDRRDLSDALDVSRVTVGRVLGDLEARGWVESDGGGYRATPLGEVVAVEFEDLLETMGTMRELSTVAQWLPSDLDVDFRRFTGCRVTTPTWSDSVAPVRRASELAREATTLHVAGSGIAPGVIEGIREAAVAGGTVTFVTTTDGVAVLESSREMSEWMTEAMAAGAELFSHPGFPYLIALCDGTGVIGVNDDDGVPRGFVESEDVAVLEWVRTTIARCRSEATPVGKDSFVP
jgi:predicted transcriptional regulator